MTWCSGRDGTPGLDPPKPLVLILWSEGPEGPQAADLVE